MGQSAINCRAGSKKIEKVLKIAAIAAEIDENHVKACWLRAGIGLRTEIDQSVFTKIEEDMSQIDLTGE